MKALFTFLALLSLSVPAAAEDLRVENPWVREAPPTARVLGAFMHLHNTTDQEMIITGATSPDFEHVEIHRTVVEDGMARMIAQDNLTLGPDSHIDLKPGDYHLMLITPKKSHVVGDKIEITLSYGESGSRTIGAEVRKGMGKADDHSHHHHHH